MLSLVLVSSYGYSMERKIIEVIIGKANGIDGFSGEPIYPKMLVDLVTLKDTTVVQLKGTLAYKDALKGSDDALYGETKDGIVELPNNLMLKELDTAGIYRLGIYPEIYRQ